ncbi:dodecin domain-containing protein [Streptomyces mobaraensis NBRC 13819 = DSM 40847]|nr:dodecin domain-containing protein [Streptomyces mobaraensis NBRC 13819 = DSM 40847]
MRELDLATGFVQADSDWFEVVQIRGHFAEGGGVGHYQVGLKIGFRLEDGD